LAGGVIFAFWPALWLHLVVTCTESLFIFLILAGKKMAKPAKKGATRNKTLVNGIASICINAVIYNE
jgi:hypothetical protein